MIRKNQDRRTIAGTRLSYHVIQLPLAATDVFLASGHHISVSTSLLAAFPGQRCFQAPAVAVEKVNDEGAKHR